MRRFTTLPPLGVYVHLPWCVRKCPYCDFNSHTAPDAIPETAYVDAVLADLEQELPDIWGRTPASVFIGGGTPSLFSPRALDRLLSGLRALLALPTGIEITLEANPGTVDSARFREYRAIGLNRLSIGVQSFDDASLDALGRIHDGNQARLAVDTAHEAGFEEINIDLMFGLPGQSIRAALRDVDAALALAPSHVSLYELTIEPNTWFARHPPPRPPDTVRERMHGAAIERLAADGLPRYEISAFAAPRHQSEHNRNYWLFGDYLGIGAGAHGKLSDANRGDIRRRWKQKQPQRFLQTAHTPDRLGGERVVDHDDTGIEFMMNALRLVDGFPVALFEAHTGVSLDPWTNAIERGVEQGLLERADGRIRCTPRGFDLLNDVLLLFMEPDTTRRYPVIPLRARGPSD